jgi:CHAD domain-containing protein
MLVKADSVSTEAMHEWRMQVKRHWHALEVFLPVRPTELGRTIRSARRLADALGEDHDLSLLTDRLRTAQESPEEPVRALIEAIELRRRHLRRRALKTGAALYAEPPAVMEQRLRHDWRMWRKSKGSPAG